MCFPTYASSKHSNSATELWPAGYEAEDGGWPEQAWQFARMGLHFILCRKAHANNRTQYCTLKVDVILIIGRYDFTH